MADFRTGIGYDMHQLGGAGPIILGGVAIDHHQGVIGTSDADVAAHALCDALLGAAALGDLGEHFPSSDSQWHGADSLELLSACVGMVSEAGFRVVNVDVTILVEQVRVAPHRDEMRGRLATVLGTGVDTVSVKATTTDGLGPIGSNEGIAAQAIATISSG